VSREDRRGGGDLTPKIVAKFGGSNLKHRDDIQRLVSAVTAYGRPMVVVVSAFFGVTNRLASALENALFDEHSADVEIEALRESAMEIIAANIAEGPQRLRTEATVNERLEELRRLLLGVAYLADVPAKVRDLVMSYGERLSSPTVAAIFREAGIDAREALPEDIGLITDGEAGNATVDFAASAPRVAAALADDAVFVLPGFYGVGPDGRVTLLGRGGSDYSAAAVARCITAESLDIWKDVDGYLSADPSTVDNPRRLEVLSYREAAELSYFGARILHPRTVEPLRDRGIPLRLFNIHRHGEGIVPVSRIEALHGVLIDASGREVTHRVKSVTSSPDLGILRLSGAGVGSRAGVLGRASAALADGGINIKSVVTTQTSINIFLSRDDLAAARAAVARLDLTTVAALDILDEYGIVALVGEGLEECEEIAETLILALSRAGLHAKMISIGASAAATYFVIRREHIRTAVRAVHEAFFPA
jgi:aspartokinase/homoserine dehydrogenase 1